MEVLKLIHSSNFKPRIIPLFEINPGNEMDRVQDISSTTTLNRTKVEEVGREGVVDYRSSLPSVNVTVRQLEYGNIEIFQRLANKSNSVAAINLTDFKNSAVDIVGYKTDDSGTFLGSIWYPNLRLSGFSFNIGAPDALLERNLTLVGEDEVALLNSNAYLLVSGQTIAAGSNSTLTIASPSPVADPDNSGQFLFRVVRGRSNVWTELNHGTDWSYNGSGTLTINGTSVAGDYIKYWYSAGSYFSGQSTFVNNDTDVSAISADSVSIFLQSSTYLYKLQSVSVDTTFDRTDYREIGNKNVVQRGARDITNRITLGRILEAYTIEEILRGKADQSYGKISAQKLSSGFNLIIKIFSDDSKDVFKLGYKFLDLAPVSRDTGQPVNEYVNAGVVLEGEEAIITNQTSVL
jgi:hypothetical protein